MIAVSAKNGASEAALIEAEKLLRTTGKTSEDGEAAAVKPKTIRSAMKSAPDANVCVVSVAGRYAADEAWEPRGTGEHERVVLAATARANRLTPEQRAALFAQRTPPQP